MNGGYAMLDCTGLDLSVLGKVDGLYERGKKMLETGKPVVLYGIVNDDQGFSPIAAFGGVESSTSIFFSFYPVTIHIDNTDTVTM